MSSLLSVLQLFISLSNGEKQLFSPRFTLGKANSVAAWQWLEMDFNNILEHLLCGRIETKLSMFRDILDKECSNQFWEITSKCGIAPRGTLSSWYRDVHAKGSWRKLTKEERVGLKVLGDKVKQSLGSLCREECVCKCRKKCTSSAVGNKQDT